jgi:hypothetical protein
MWPDLTTDTKYQISNGIRRVGDRSTLIIPLDTNNVQQALTSDSAIEFSQFEVFTAPEPLFGQRHSERHGSPQLRLQELVSPALRHGYTSGSSSWYDFVMERLQRWVRLELLKLKVEERPEQLRNGIPYYYNISIPSDFQPPKTWDCCDDLIPMWYREWEQMAPEETDPWSQNAGRSGF